MKIGDWFYYVNLSNNKHVCHILDINLSKNNIDVMTYYTNTEFRIAEGVQYHDVKYKLIHGQALYVTEVEVAKFFLIGKID